MLLWKGLACDMFPPRYSDAREVHVRAPFSGVPLLGGWFAIRPPDHLVTLQTTFTEAFLIQDIEVRSVWAKSFVACDLFCASEHVAWHKTNNMAHSRAA
jgi:hypothetical protein